VSLLGAINGTLLNALTVLVGGIFGTLLGNRFPQRVHESLFGVLGLFTLLIGMLDALKSGDPSGNPLIVLGALLLGVLLGEWVNLEGLLNRFGDRVQQLLARDGSKVSEAFVTSSLVFCVGPLSIIGALDNGLNGDITKLAIKATLDGFAALAFSAALGWGVLLSVGTILIYQGALSLSAQALAPVLNANPQTITNLTATGGLILVAIGLKLLKIKDLRVANLLPALLIAPLLVLAVAQAPHIFP
jgi:uncharacterized membrane protein YqgA involved in biofilm formation